VRRKLKGWRVGGVVREIHVGGGRCDEIEPVHDHVVSLESLDDALCAILAALGYSTLVAAKTVCRALRRAAWVPTAAARPSLAA
jgi:hypothetical protein